MTWTPTHLTRAQLEERRFAGAKLLQAGRLSQAEIARQLGVSRTAVSKWAKRLRTGGLVRLQRRTATGRPSKLSRRQKHRLKQRLQQGALRAGFATDRWTLKRIQQLIERDFAIAYHPNYLARLLNRLGFSVQQPTDRALERDDARVEAWLKRDWPRIKKSPSA